MAEVFRQRKFEADEPARPKRVALILGDPGSGHQPLPRVLVRSCLALFSTKAMITSAMSLPIGVQISKGVDEALRRLLRLGKQLTFALRALENLHHHWRPADYFDEIASAFRGTRECDHR